MKLLLCTAGAPAIWQNLWIRSLNLIQVHPFYNFIKMLWEKFNIILLYLIEHLLSFFWFLLIFYGPSVWLAGWLCGFEETKEEPTYGSSWVRRNCVSSKSSPFYSENRLRRFVETDRPSKTPLLTSTIFLAPSLVSEKPCHIKDPKNHVAISGTKPNWMKNKIKKF